MFGCSFCIDDINDCCLVNNDLRRSSANTNFGFHDGEWLSILLGKYLLFTDLRIFDVVDWLSEIPYKTENFAFDRFDSFSPGSIFRRGHYRVYKPWEQHIVLDQGQCPTNRSKAFVRSRTIG